MSATDDGGARPGLARPAEPAAAARARKTRTPRSRPCRQRTGPQSAGHRPARRRRLGHARSGCRCWIRTAASRLQRRGVGHRAGAAPRRAGARSRCACRNWSRRSAPRASPARRSASSSPSRLPSPRWSEAFVAPVALSGGAPGRAGVVVITVHDLTPIRRVEEMRADFVANVSHELRTPLAALTGFIETLQGPARDDPAARERFLGIMQAQAWRMARLIDDLLSLSRIELRAHQRPDTPVDLVPIVRQVADGLQTLARDRDVAVEIAAPAEPLMVPGDRDELIRLFENLIENGLKYGASGKRVDIALAPSDADGKGEARRLGARLRAGHRGRASAAADRAVLPRRCRRKPRAGRHRLGPCAGQAHPQPPPRPALDRQQGGRGRDLHGAPADDRRKRGFEVDFLYISIS